MLYDHFDQLDIRRVCPASGPRRADNIRSLACLVLHERVYMEPDLQLNTRIVGRMRNEETRQPYLTLLYGQDVLGPRLSVT